MNKPLKFTCVAIGAILLPGVVIAVSLLRSGERFRDLIEWLPLNWATLVLPQLFVIAVAIFFPQLRKLATRALILLTVLFLLFSYITSLDPNGPMLWVFYFGLCVLSLVILALFPSSRENTRGL